MIEISNVLTLTGERKSFLIKSNDTVKLDATNLIAFPGLIDPHVHFRVPGQEYKEDWCSAAAATLRGGYTTVFDMPNNLPPCITQARLVEKKELINRQLQAVDIPLRYQLYLGADKNHFDEIYKVKKEIIGIKVFMGSSTGDLLMDDESSLHAAFAIATKLNLVVAIHAEDEEMIQQRRLKYKSHASHYIHSEIRSPEVAAKAVAKVIELVKLYGTRAYILHVSSISELELIAKAKKAGLPIFAETSPHHLFLDTDAYTKLQGKAQMNPPLRSKEHRLALFEAIHEGVIDTIGSDHAPHTLAEKSKPYGESPSGVPGIETNLPLLLNAYNQGLLSLNEIVALTCYNIQKLFNLEANEDLVLVDLNQEKVVDQSKLKTKCGWSPFADWKLKGWPVYTIFNNRIYNLQK
ncbi:MAG: dihydroorotase [Gammaproteobacteria bacterium RIFCSPHIGHO2_12_FULL_35_23]|nr:MAG: dihydroorotase [Gammaproteobacteria bacterium RIFCSPHIGHO2_12_FULL_35_23]